MIASLQPSLCNEAFSALALTMWIIPPEQTSCYCTLLHLEVSYSIPSTPMIWSTIRFHKCSHVECSFALHLVYLCMLSSYVKLTWFHLIGIGAWLCHPVCNPSKFLKVGWECGYVFAGDGIRCGNNAVASLCSQCILCILCDHLTF